MSHVQAAAAAPTLRNHPRIAFLDLFRLLSAVAVMLFHYAFHGGITHKYVDIVVPALIPVARYGYLGVNVFFVISGLVIGYSASGSSAGNFAWRRWLRVYPTFVFCMLLSAAVAAFAGDPRFAFSGRQVVANLIVDAPRLGYGYVDGVYWTIVAEIKFYCWVALGLSVPWLRRRSAQAFLAWLLLSALNEYAIHSMALRYLLVSDFAGFFVTGICLCRLAQGARDWATWLSLPLSLLFALSCELRHAVLMSEGPQGAPHAAVIVVVLLAAIGLLAWSVSWKLPSRMATVLTEVGGFTYPLYLLHATIGFIIINRLAGPIGAFPAVGVAAVVTLAASVVVYEVVEPRLKAGIKAVAARVLQRRSIIRRPRPAPMLHDPAGGEMP